MWKLHSRQKFNKSQVDPTCLLCQRYNKTLEHYILNCSALYSVGLPILNQISISYKNLSSKTFERLESNLKIQIIIDCSLIIGQKRANKSKVRIQDLSETGISFETTGSCAVKPYNVKIFNKDRS